MANIRFVFDNAAERATSLISTSTAGSLFAVNMKTDIKSDIWRTGAVGSVIITVEWTTAESIDTVVLANANFTPAASVRVRAFTLSGDVTPVVDKTVLACQGYNNDWGNSAYAAVYITKGNYQKLTIQVTDTTPTGYMQASKLICGAYWSPEYTAEAGVQLGVTDRSKSERTDAGDLVTDRGTMHRTLNLDLNYMPKADRDKMYTIMRKLGTFKPMFVSVTPEDADFGSEQIFQLYGKMTKLGGLRYEMYNQFNTQLEIEEF